MEVKEALDGYNNIIYDIYKENTKNKNIYRFIKRSFDILVSLMALILSSPIFLLTAVLIKNGSDGPVFFLQKRIGKNGKLFKLYKFRTMKLNADKELRKILENDPKAREEYELNKKLENDPRITSIGHIIRKLSLDELPQLINILKGDMTFVGPRPYLYREKKDMGEYYKKIIIVKPGLTGLWQVSGRNNITFNDRLKLDEKYVENYSLKYDIKIFFKTFMVILKREGAK